MDNRETRLAVLIDADNAPRSALAEIMAEIVKYGTPTVKRIYGDWTGANMNSWKQPLLDHAIIPMQQYSYTTGKNSTDSAMIIDAMDILYAGSVDGFVLVSSDSDFTRLALRLREAGLIVYGIGEKKTPKPFIAACNKFIYVEVIRSAKTPAASPRRNGDTLPSATKPPASSCNDRDRNRDTSNDNDDIEDLIAETIQDVSDDSGWAFLGVIGNVLLKKRPDFDSRNYGYKKLSELIRNLSRFDIDERPSNDPKSPKIYVRSKGEAR